MEENINIRRIEESDNKAIAKVIRIVMEEFDVARPGTIYFDKVLDDMFAQYVDAKSVYYVVEQNGTIVGGCGINKLSGAGEEYCELQRMFLLKKFRGRGLAQQLLDKCMTQAVVYGYSYCYLESIHEFSTAIRLYKKNGFEHVYGPIGNTGHFSCEIKMVKPLTES